MAQALLIRQNAPFTSAGLLGLYNDIKKLLLEGGFSDGEPLNGTYDFSQVVGSKVANPPLAFDREDVHANGSTLYSLDKEVLGVEEYGKQKHVIGYWKTPDPVNTPDHIFLGSSTGMEFPAANQDYLSYNGTPAQGLYGHRMYLDKYCRNVLVVASNNGFFIIGDNLQGGLNVSSDSKATRNYCWYGSWGVRRLEYEQIKNDPLESKGSLVWTNGWNVLSPIQDPSLATNSNSTKYYGMFQGYSTANLVNHASGDFMTKSKENITRRLQSGYQVMIQYGNWVLGTILGTAYGTTAGANANRDDASTVFRPFGSQKKADGQAFESLCPILIQGWDDSMTLDSISGDLSLLAAIGPLEKGVPFSVQTIAGEQVILIPNRQTQVAADRSKTFLAFKVA